MISNYDIGTLKGIALDLLGEGCTINAETVMRAVKELIAARKVIEAAKKMAEECGCKERHTCECEKAQAKALADALIEGGFLD